MNDYLDFAKELAKEAGKIMLQYSKSDTKAEWKDDFTPLTIADTKINRLVAETIIDKYPAHGLLGEEESIDLESDYIWVCDPIDGTVPFMSGIPVSSFNLSLVHNGASLVAVQYNPWIDQLYTAVKGEGAYLNGQKLSVKNSFSGRKVINLEIYGGLGSTMFDDAAVELEAKKALPEHEYIHVKLVSVGFSVALVASGKIAAAIFSGMNPYEAGVGNLLVTEAGGLFTDIYGLPIQSYSQPIRGFIAAAPAEHKNIVSKLSPVVDKAILK